MNFSLIDPMTGIIGMNIKGWRQNMERIAIISDIHGNMPALKAVLKDSEDKQVTEIYCLGDLVGKGPDSELVVDLIREHCNIVVRGNWDENIATHSEWQTMKWHQAVLGEERLAYLRSLPFQHDFYLSGQRVRLLHASPESVHVRVYQSDPLEKRLAMFQNTKETGGFLNTENQPDIVGYGDIHWSFVQYLREKTLFNTGSVGNSLERPDASYVILEGHLHSEKKESYSITVIRVPYDNEMAVQLAKQKQMPDLEPYIKEVRTARYRGWKD